MQEANKSKKMAVKHERIVLISANAETQPRTCRGGAKAKKSR
ncbi:MULTISPECIES: hypothetical protein [unclassified Rudaea]|nr:MULTISPECIES: hypothetical protein [unclassified Rudaea]